MKTLIFMSCLLGLFTGGLSDKVSGWTYAKQANPDEPCGSVGQQLCGVDNWCQVSTLCNGLSQSPINLAQDDSVSKHEPIPKFSKESCTNWVQESSDHALEVYLESCNFKTTYKDNIHLLDHIHFHSPSEHTLEGVHLDAEAHLVHKDGEGSLLVISVLLQVRDVPNNPFLNQLWTAGGDNIRTGVKTDAFCAAGINPYNTLVPADHSHFAYTGSLTTPNCDPNIKWMVFSTPMQISTKDLELIRAASRARSNAIVHASGDNNRPIMDRNGRTVNFVTDGAPQHFANPARYIRTRK